MALIRFELCLIRIIKKNEKYSNHWRFFGIGASLIEKFKNDPNYQVISTFNRGNVSTGENIETFKLDVLSDNLDIFNPP